MDIFAQDFGPFSSIWLNTSHQRALPKTAVAALNEAIQWKISPERLSHSSMFSIIPTRLREILGKLINAPPEDIILGNSASYGLHLLANGIKWFPGDEILLVESDFPCNILPWLSLKKLGVKIRAIRPKYFGLLPNDVLESIGKNTKLLCTSWVYSYSGHIINLPVISRICREKGGKLVLNCSQGIGTIPFDTSWGFVDAMTCVGFKWLCGPYGTGFCWIDPGFREELNYNQAYWLAMQTADDLKTSPSWPEIRTDLGARQYDVFGTANFFNFVPWTASVTYLLDKGIERIRAHNNELINHLRNGICLDKYEILTPLTEYDDSTILVISHKDRTKNEAIFEKLTKKNIYISLRRKHLRFAPHLYNTIDEIDAALQMLNDV